MSLRSSDESPDYLWPTLGTEENSDDFQALLMDMKLWMKDDLSLFHFFMQFLSLRNGSKCRFGSIQVRRRITFRFLPFLSSSHKIPQFQLRRFGLMITIRWWSSDRSWIVPLFSLSSAPASLLNCHPQFIFVSSQLIYSPFHSVNLLQNFTSCSRECFTSSLSLGYFSH